MKPERINVGCEAGESEGFVNCDFYVQNTGLYYVGRVAGYSYRATDENYYDMGYIFKSAAEPGKLIAVLESDHPCNVRIRKGEFLDIIYDGGKKKRLFFPEINGEKTTLYFAEDGSSYYDADLTQLAEKAPSFFVTISPFIVAGVGTALIYLLGRRMR